MVHVGRLIFERLPGGDVRIVDVLEGRVQRVDSSRWCSLLAQLSALAHQDDAYAQARYLHLADGPPPRSRPVSDSLQDV